MTSQALQEDTSRSRGMSFGTSPSNASPGGVHVKFPIQVVKQPTFGSSGGNNPPTYRVTVI